ncbi:ABC transporter substrate-binding protein [Jiangella muralis]|uniref:ABC transporter substrate-binding protein n=1 Tax=Jiangella muralis TaxID=702383 RepID=UPI00069F27AD|nr:extracellular solute-binding protein [Jiangella muralis]
MAITRRALLGAGLGVSALAVLGGCNRSSAESNTSDGEIAGEIRFSIWFGSGDIEMWEDVIAGFAAVHPDVSVKFEPLEYDQYYTKLNTQFASGNAPDVLGMQFQSSIWGPSGLLAPLTEAVSGDIGQVPASLTGYGRAAVDGTEEQFALPWRFVGHSLYGNLTALAEAGIERPDTWSLDDLVAAAKKLTTDDAFGLHVPGVSGETSIASTFGASPVSADGLTATYDAAEMIAHKSFLRDLVHVHKVSPGPDVLSTQQDAFASGQVRMAFAGSWSNPTYREGITAFDWDILPNPGGERPAKNYAGPDHIAVYAKSRNLAAATAFVQYAVFHRDAQTLIAATGAPVLNDYLKDAERIASEAALKPAHYEYFIDEATENGTGWTFVPAFAELERLEADANYAIMSDPGSDIPGILADLNAKVQSALDSTD